LLPLLIDPTNPAPARTQLDQQYQQQAI
jgi:hypothetical protein